MTKPWADPSVMLYRRLIDAEIAIANVDTAAERRAIMRELAEAERASALELAAIIAAGNGGTRAEKAIRAVIEPHF